MTQYMDGLTERPSGTENCPQMTKNENIKADQLEHKRVTDSLMRLRTDSCREAMKTLSKQLAMAAADCCTSAGDLESMWMQ